MSNTEDDNITLEWEKVSESINTEPTSKTSSTTTVQAKQGADSLFGTLNELHKQISEAIESDNNFKSLIEKVRFNQALRSINSVKKKILCEENMNSTMNIEYGLEDQNSIDLFLEETGVQSIIDNMKAEFDKIISSYKNSLASTLSTNAELIKNNENLIEERDRAKETAKSLASSSKNIGSELAFQKKVTDKFYSELKRLSQKYSMTNDIVDSFTICDKFLHSN